MALNGLIYADVPLSNYSLTHLCSCLRVEQKTCYYAPPLTGAGIKRCFYLTSICLTSVAYIGPNSRTERPRKTKIGTEIAHVTRDSDTTSKIKKSRSPGHFTQRGLNA